MVYVTMKPTKLGLEGPERRLIKTTLSTKNVKNLEKMCTNLICGAKDRSFRVKGLVEMPTKVLNIIPRKSSCGEGTNTWDKFELQVHECELTFSAPRCCQANHH
ncbi:40S ribosomal protein S20-like [Solanum tuberosum]|uniref:40S ribosomal protein S20-like n=1 Tax=Solanum tuberosum TaxID=4113 RepID=UPI000739FAB6|nr:PREDICTED: 40S ribosomal protein S20-like [Solanum tuberosum]